MRNFKIETQCPFNDNRYGFRKVILKQKVEIIFAYTINVSTSNFLRSNSCREICLAIYIEKYGYVSKMLSLTIHVANHNLQIIYMAIIILKTGFIYIYIYTYFKDILPQNEKC